MRSLLMTLGALSLAPALHAQSAITSHDVRVPRGADTLAVTFVIPDGPGPFPGVVLVHGSHAGTREMWPYRLHAYDFARHGIAVAVYDKRGAGASTGRYRESESFTVLADDALAVHGALQRAPRVDAQRVGLWGRSQGAWVVTEAAARERSVAFLALVVGGGVTGLEQNIYQRQMRLRNGGAPEAVITRMTRVWEVLWHYMRTATGRELATAEVAAVRREPWFASVASTMAGLRPDGTLADSAWVVANRDTELTFFTQVHAFDPLAPLRRTTIPVLGVFGGADALTPSLRSIERLEEALRDRVAGGSRLILFPGADHMLCPARPKGEMVAGCVFVPAYEETTRDWILAVTAR